MPKYLIKASYTQAGAKGVAGEGGSSRRDAVKAVCDSVGGSLESFYFAFGEVDVYTVVDLPDEEAAIAIAIAVNGSGGATIETVPLVAPETVDAAAKREVSFRPAGG
jgi:uncharacterized protein with GYD domain